MDFGLDWMDLIQALNYDSQGFLNIVTDLD